MQDKVQQSSQLPGLHGDPGQRRAPESARVNRLTPADIVAAARRYIGTPFRHQGRVCGSGVDCVGLLAGIARDLGIEITDETNYGRNPRSGAIERHLERYCMQIDPSEMRPGDIVVFWIRRPDRTRHAGVVSEVGVIHAFSRMGGGGRVAETGLTDHWRKRIASAWRVYPWLL